MTNPIENLQSTYIKINLHLANWDALGEWAIERLINHEDNNDEHIILLAGCSFEDEAMELANKILSKYLHPEKRNKEYWAGKYIISLHEMFTNKELNITDLDEIFSKIYRELNYPDWLVMLTRNCEYATDIDNFEIPFLDEFNYIAQLWKICDNLTEFQSKYDRAISNTHDVQGS
jgi:hypothetical protein